jgi:tripartite-type tricarboxylate transporter receptor subunit TctC
MAEAGFSGQDSDTLLGFLVPARTPEPIVAKLHHAIARALRQLDTEGKMTALGFEPIVNTPAEFAALIKVDVAKWAGVIEAARIKVP